MRLPLSPPSPQGSVAGSRAFRAPLRRGRLAVRPVGERRKTWNGLRGPPCANQCESASKLDPAPVEHQIIEAEVELLISGAFDRRPTVTPLFSRKEFNCNAL